MFSWDDLAQRAGVTHDEARRSAERLRREGFPVVSLDGQGCTIPEDEDILCLPGIYRGLATRVLGRQICYTLTTGSTNDDAKALAGICPEGTLVTCEAQTKGKGRLSRQWESPRGGIFMSLILKPQIPPAAVPSLALAAGCAVAAALEATGIDAEVKWPNDVLVEGKKLAGILCELGATGAGVQHVIVGIGVNANIPASRLPQELRERSISLSQVVGKPVDRSTLIARVLNQFEPLYFRFLESGIEPIIPEISTRLAYLGQPVMIHNTALGSGDVHHGILRGLDRDGSLLIETPEGDILRFAAGDLSLRAK